MLRKLVLTGFASLIIAGSALAADPAEHPETGDPLVLQVLRGTETIDGNVSD